MQFRRSGQRDERRRRVLMDDSLAACEDGGSTPAPRSRAAKAPDCAAPAKRYADAARPERQPRITDLVPLRPWTLTVLVLALLAVVAALAGFDGEAVGWSRSVGRANLAALDLSARGSVASWYSSLILAGAAAASVLVFLLRRHKVDDYRGRYRFWLWAAAVLAVGSIDATAGVHRIFGGLLARLTGTLTVGDGVGWSLLLGVALFGSLAVRAVFEIRHSRGALASLLAAVAAYGTSAALLAGMLSPYLPLTDFAGQTAAMLGHVAVLFCVLLSARYVLLDAQGKLPPRAPRRRRESSNDERHASGDKAPRDGKAEGEASRAAGGKLRVDKSRQEAAASPPSTSSAASAASRKQQHSDSQGPDAGAPAGTPKKLTTAVVDEEKAGDNSSRKLSKAERRRLRKLQRRGERV